MGTSTEEGIEKWPGPGEPDEPAGAGPEQRRRTVILTCFLDWLVQRYLGPPTHREGDCPCWPCPKCGHRGWHVLPVKAGYKDRFRCWSCDFRGDEYDLLLHYHPRDPWEARKARAESLREE
jgi:hypothetical protein